MERLVNGHPNMILTAQDFDNVGIFGRDSLDHIVKDGIDHNKRYTGFTVLQSAAAEVTVGNGRYYRDGAVYFNADEGGTTVDMIEELPAVARRIATIVVFGNAVETDLQPRSFLIDPVTRQVEGRVVAVESRRAATIGVVYGDENATPQAPTIDSNYVAVATVLLTPTGIDTITMLTANQLRSVRKNYEDIVGIQDRLGKVGSAIDTLRTDVSGLGVAVKGKADRGFVNLMAMDLARAKEVIGLPDDYTAYGADHYLDELESDPTRPGYSCKVEEGIRFPPAAQASVPLALENAIDARVVVNDNMVLPAFVPVKRIQVAGKDGEYALSSTTHETVTLVQKSITRTRIRWGTKRRECTNAAWWRSGKYDQVKQTFTRKNPTTGVVETFKVENDKGRIEANGLTHWVRVTQFWEDNYEEAYWDRVTTTENVSGSIVAQTFVNSQDGYLVGLNLPFTKIALAGAVRVLLCETNDAGVPQLDKVLAKAVLQPADLKVYPAQWTPASFAPTFIGKGRFAWVLISAGAHFVATVANNKFAQGTLFYSTDGTFAQGDLFTDAPFEAIFAQFMTTRVEVQLSPLELAGGIADIDINVDSFRPDGTKLIFAVRVDGVWRELEDTTGTHPLASLPNLTQAKAILLGTTDLMPGFGIGASRSSVTVSRPAQTFLHVSSVRTMPAPVDTIELNLRFEQWSAADNTSVAKILVGTGYNTVELADVVSSSPAPDDPTALVRKCTFNLAAAVTSYKIQIEGTTSGVQHLFHVADRADVAFA